MKTSITGIKKAVSELKNAKFGRVYLNINTGEVVALECVSLNSGWLNSEELREVGTYDPRYGKLTMASVKAMVEDYIIENDL